MDPWQQGVGLLAAAANDLAPVHVADVAKSNVRGQAVRHHDGARCDGLLDKGQQALARGVANTLEPDPPDGGAPDLRRDRDEGLFADVPSAPALFDTPEEGLVDLDFAGQPVATRTHHGPPQLVKPRPGRLVAAEPKDPLQAKGACAVLLRRHPPHRLEPQTQRAASPVEDRARRDRRLVTALFAVHQTAPGRPSVGRGASRASKTARPAKLHEVLPASVLRSKPSVKLGQRPWILRVGHGRTLPVPVTGGKGICLCA